MGTEIIALVDDIMIMIRGMSEIELEILGDTRIKKMFNCSKCNKFVFNNEKSNNMIFQEEKVKYQSTSI